ncbi:MAG: UDP-2,3-diacylglucosamine diphosphatase [Pirellulaceae bacterium]|jgi:UDP-2,3-diacylglucosamine pyrophosphatase LpxH|nr:UDP-2,3-diacylglucosamine diphosphatase [Pirellulaceae bacterium]
MNVRTLFLSDVHLGSRHAQTARLLDFLKWIKRHARPERIYIVGDFIDGWKLRRSWYWTDDCNLILRKLLSLVKDGTEVYYLAGNHDEFLREFMRDFPLLEFGSVHVGDEFIHETADGRRLLVLHGDRFDLVAKCARWLYHLGDVGYELLLRLNPLVNFLRRILRRKDYWSLSKAVKHNVKQACNYMGDFERFLAAYARERGCAGCVCGHIHTAAIRPLDDDFLYVNTGDWIESCTAVLEDAAGNLTLYHYGDHLMREDQVDNEADERDGVLLTGAA